MTTKKAGMFGAVTCALLFAYACSSGSGNDPQPDAPSAPRCGDGVCAATEVNSCPADCGSSAAAVCGNGTCESSKGETAATCPSDCGQGSGSGSSTAVCGNGICEVGENQTSCPSDCGTMMGSGTLDCSDPNILLACIECIATQMCTGVDEPDCEVCLE